MKDYKEQVFIYFLYKLCYWREGLTKDPYTTYGDANISILKAWSLVTFCTSLNLQFGKMFDDFRCYPLGIHSDSIKGILETNYIGYHDINEEGLFSEVEKLTLSSEDKEIIDSAVSTLKTKNVALVVRSPLYLTDLMHEWLVFRDNYKEGEARMEPVTVSEIINTQRKFYTF